MGHNRSGVKARLKARRRKREEERLAAKAAKAPGGEKAKAPAK